MNWYKKAEQISEYTSEMEDFYKKRTKEHIDRVRKFCKKIADYDPDRFSELIDRGLVHDQSKFENPEKIPYIFVSWKYKCKDDGKEFEVSPEIENKMHEATEHHVTHNSHHPEYHTENQSEIINKENRDKPPKKVVDATKMPELDVAEMVADWCAMSDEKGGTPKEWADDNIGKRWNFTDEQKDLIYELIDAVWD